MGGRFTVCSTAFVVLPHKPESLSLVGAASRVRTCEPHKGNGVTARRLQPLDHRCIREHAKSAASRGVSIATTMAKSEVHDGSRLVIPIGKLPYADGK